MGAHLKKSKISIFTLCFIIYSFTATASYGIEDMVGWGGPALTLLVLLVVPIIWAIPMSLVSAELTSMYPEDGGLYVWIGKAMGPMAGFMAGWWYFLCSLSSTAVFLVVAVSYLEMLAGGFDIYTRFLVSAALVFLIAFINIKGVGALGSSAVVFVLIAVTPFIIATFMGIGQMEHDIFANFSLSAFQVDGFASYGLILGMWMYCGYEAIGSVAEEVDGAYSLIPKGLFICLPITALFYIVPTLVGSAVVGDWSSWGAEAGEGVITFVEMGERIGGTWLMIAFLVSALFSNLTCYNAYIASTSRFPFVMARDHLFFKSFAKVSEKYGTPLWAILVTSIVNIILSVYSFATLLVMAMTLYFFPVAMFMLSALILRYTKPDEPRPYKVPGGNGFLALIVAMPILVIIFAFYHMTASDIINGIIGLATGPVVYYFFRWYYRKDRLAAEEALAAKE